MKLSNGQYMVFVFPEQVKLYREGKEVVASTERFTDGDIPLFVTPDEYGAESNGATLVRIKKGGWN